MFSQEMCKIGKKPSCIRQLFEYGMTVAEKIGKENVYDYSIGNPSVPAPKEVNEAIVELTKMDSLSVHGYTPAAGDSKTRQAIAGDITNRTGMTIDAGDIFITCGAAPALTSVFTALAVEGAEFIATAPYFPEYQVYVKLSGGKLVIVPADTETFQIPLQALEAAITPHTQAVIVNSPNNPSGVIYSRETLEKLAGILERKSQEYGHPIYIVSDEPYRELVYDILEVPFIPTIYPNTIVCYSYSKSLSLPGDRIGYVCIPACAADHDDLLPALAGSARSLGHVCAPAIMQKMLAKCVHLRPDIRTYDENRQLLYNELTAMGFHCVKPQGAFYLLMRAPGGDANAFSEAAKQKNLLIVPCDDFGCPGFLRMSTCVAKDMILRSLPAWKELREEYRQ